VKAQVWRRISFAVVAVLFVGCSSGTDEARRGVAAFRARVAEGSLAEIYRTAGAELRGAATEDEFLRFMTALDAKLGPWQSAVDPVWSFTRGTAGHFVHLTYQSQFAKGAATERFSWRIANGAPVLLGYHVNSPLLVSQ
jgi:hypothetical protein